MRKLILLFIVILLITVTGCKNYENEINTLSLLSDKINSDFLKIRNTTAELASFSADLYKNQKNYIQTDMKNYTLLENGVYFKKNDDGGSAVFVSGSVPVNKNIIDTVSFTEPMDAAFKKILNDNKSIVQAYYNDKNSYNRIYPYFDVLSQYQPGVIIPSFNFYYLADKEHNPGQSVIWVNEAYVDPAGRGWMISCIAPVYYQDSLEGVVGLDITIPRIAETYISEKDEYLMIVDNKGTIIHAYDYTINLLGFKQLVDHKYIETVKSDTFLLDEYNFFKSRAKEVRKMADVLLNTGATKYEFKNEKGSYHIICLPIDEIGWYLLKIIEK